MEIIKNMILDNEMMKGRENLSEKVDTTTKDSNSTFEGYNCATVGGVMMADGAMLPSMQGELLKWTNFFGGWQQRYFILKDGILSYYKSSNELNECRGSVPLRNAKLDIMSPDRNSDLRLNVIDEEGGTWHLKAKGIDTFKEWTLSLNQHKAYYVESGYESEITRSALSSMYSGKFSRSSSVPSELMEEPENLLKQRFDQICAFRDLAVQQICTLQNKIEQLLLSTDFNKLSSLRECSNQDHFFTCPICDNVVGERKEKGEKSANDGEQTFSDYKKFLYVEFENEVSAFKSTADGLLVNVNCYIDSMQRRDTVWRSKCIMLQQKLQNALGTVSVVTDLGIDANSDDREKESNKKKEHKEESDYDEPTFEQTAKPAPILNQLKQDTDTLITKNSEIIIIYPDREKKIDHTLAYLAHRTFGAMVQHIELDRQDCRSEEGWQCIHTEGSMNVYRREMEVNGRTVDPLKMEMVVRGVSGYEMCWYFWNPDYRADWDATIENLRVIDRIGENGVVCHQIHKRVWPSAQRDACIISQLASFVDKHEQPLTIKHVEPNYLKKQSTWIVVNQSVNHDSAPEQPPDLVRVVADVAMTCETFTINEGQERNDIFTRITYVASINPGGWVPAAGVRALAKREFPKFLSRFTNYVKEQTKHSTPIFQLPPYN